MALEFGRGEDEFAAAGISPHEEWVVRPSRAAIAATSRSGACDPAGAIGAACSTSSVEDTSSRWCRRPADSPGVHVSR